MRSTDVVIIGGGVIGASIAHHLASAGCARIRVLDSAPAPGGGSTGRATGGFRAQFGSEVNVRLSLLSREKLTRFQEEVGADPDFRPCGYLFLAETPATLASLRGAGAAQRQAGFRDAVEVSADEVRDINPAVRPDFLVGGVFAASDGFIRPMAILQGYAASARRLGARFDYGEPCTGLRVRGGRVMGVETPSGVIPCGAVVNAAGPWAARVARLAGVEIPVAPLRRQVAVTAPFPGLPDDMPMTVFADDGFHLRVRDGRVLLLAPDEPDPSRPYDEKVEPAWVEGVARRARQVVPCLVDARIEPRECWAGLYEMSPDGHALLGPAPGADNLFLANGSSGHGVMHAPALGQLLAEIMLEGSAHSIDVAALRPSRFAEGEPLTASVLL